MFILYTTEDGKNQIQLRAEQDTVWLSQRQMAELFDVSQDNISLHLKNIYADQELQREATTEKSSVVQKEGSREVSRPLTLYNLDAILSVGYRVRSPRGGETLESIRDLFALSTDSDKTGKATRRFFATVLNFPSLPACPASGSMTICPQQTRRASACMRNSAGVFCPGAWMNSKGKEAA